MLAFCGASVQERMEVVDREELGDVGPVVLVLERRDLGELAMLLGELRRRLDLDDLGVAERALGERREPAQRLDLVAEQVDPHGPVLGGGEHVEQPAADRELTAVLYLVDPLVAGGDEVEGRLVEVEQIALGQHESVGPERRVRDLLGQRHRADHDDGRAPVCRSSSISASSAAIRRPTRCGGGVRCDSYVTPRLG